jgi:hypothetical protein
MLRARFAFGRLLRLLVVGAAVLSCSSAPCPPATPSSAASETVGGNSNPAHQAALADQNLVAFSLANCLFWYFQKRGWDVEGIRSISGGYVEMGDKPAEAYERLTEFIRDYRPAIQTKHPVDVELLRCFHLSDSSAWQELVKQ